MRSTLPVLLLATALGSSAAAQVVGGAFIIATATGSTPATQLLVADTSGTVTSIGGFASDGLPPQAVASDPLTGDVLLAVTSANGNGRVLRLRLSGSAVGSESVLADLPGPVRDLAVLHTGDAYALVTGAQSGMWRVPRQGGSPSLVAALANPTALTGFGPESTYAVVVDSGTAGPPARDMALRSIEVDTGLVTTQATYVGHVPFEATGMLDLPTAVPRTVFSHPDGTVSLSVVFQNPIALQAPNFGPGSARTIAWGPAGEVLVLGGQAHPYLKALPAIPPTGTPLAWTLLAGPLPGDPVDMDQAPFDGPQFWRYGESCGPYAMNVGFADRPVLGSNTFAISLGQGAPSSPALFVLGFRDDAAPSAGGAPLPAFLPSGCTLIVDPEALTFAQTSAAGGTSQPLPIPNAANLLGLRAYCQWLQWPQLPFATSAGVALRIGRP